MTQTNCIIDWLSRSSTLHINLANTTCFSVDVLSSSLDKFSNGFDDTINSIVDTSTKVCIQDEQNIGFGWQVNKTLLLAQEQGRDSHHITSY